MYTLRLVERAQWVFFLKEMFNKHAGQLQNHSWKQLQNNFKTIPGKAYLSGVDNNNGAFVNVGN